VTTNKTDNSTPQKLYLLQLSATTVPIAPGRSLEMVLGCYLIQTNDAKNILIDTGIAPDAPLPPGAPQSQNHRRNETNVIEQLAALSLRPADIDILICTHFDMDHAGYNDAFPTRSSSSSANTTNWPAADTRALPLPAPTGIIPRCATASSMATPISSPASLCSKQAVTPPAINPCLSGSSKLAPSS